MTDLKELIAKAAEYLDWLTSNAPGPKPEEVKELVRQLYDLAERQPVRDARKVESARVSDDPKYDWRAPSSPEDTTLDGLVAELRKNARFNQEWADGVLGKNESAEYRQTRQMFADQYSGWADAVVALMAGAEPPVARDAANKQSGISLRDAMAMKALQGLLANPGGPIQANGMSGWDWCNCSPEDVASLTYSIADAMLKARENKS